MGTHTDSNTNWFNMWAILLLTLVVSVNCETCQQKSDCTLEVCNTEVECLKPHNQAEGTCTCQPPHGGHETGGSCQDDAGCHSDSQLHCPVHERHCHNTACECMPPHGG